MWVRTIWCWSPLKASLSKDQFRKARRGVTLWRSSARLKRRLRFDGDYERATAELKAALQIDPDFWLTNYSLAESQSIREDWENALATAERTNAFAPSHARATGILAAVLSRVGQT